MQSTRNTPPAPTQHPTPFPEPDCKTCRDSGRISVGEGRGTRLDCPMCTRADPEANAWCSTLTCENAYGLDIAWLPAVLWGDYPHPAEPVTDTCPACGEALAFDVSDLPNRHPLANTELWERFAQRFGRAS